MIPWLGYRPAGSTVYIPINSFAAATGASSAVSNFVAGDVQIYKNMGTTQRSSSAGITANTSFDSSVGLNSVVIDLSDNTDAGFYAAGNHYDVAIADVTIDGQTVRAWVGSFDIGPAQVNTIQVGGTTQTARDIGASVLLAAAQKVDVDTIKTQAVTCAAGVTVLASVGTAATSTAQTGDNFARLGAPAGPSVSADIVAVTAKTALIPGTQDGKTFAQTMLLMAAALLGKASGMATTTAVFRAVDDSKDRITATVDANGNRSSVTLDAT